ncbi:hypothetical protein CEP51_009562 [Fusarium floridanum]|uniref:N-acetyltransferase domain-containing protein n=1 Tax=Fusarium floridanum TaxID=1325733 RepID=A0A428RH76_9HYPO|nr:hypothetical protein CEP51_009562 [Fusarium floridanum]
MLIRNATREDIPAAGAVAAEAYIDDEQDAFMFPGRIKYPERYLKTKESIVRHGMEDPTATVIVVVLEEGDEGWSGKPDIVGFCIWFREDGDKSSEKTEEVEKKALLSRIKSIITDSEIYQYTSDLLDPLVSAQNASIMARTCRLPSSNNYFRPRIDNLPQYGIMDIAVDPGFQGRGIAGMLVEWGINKAKEEGIPIELSATPAGSGLYAKLGFEKSEQRTAPKDADAIFQELWDAALEKARESEEDRHVSEIIDTFTAKAIGDSGNEPLGARELATVIKDEMEHEINSQYHDGNTPRFVKKVISALTKFAVLGDVAVSVDPVHAALPWVAVRLVLMARIPCAHSSVSLTFAQTITAGSELREKLLGGLARVTSLFLQCNMYQRIYMNSDPATAALPEDVLNHLKTAIVEAYSSSLRFLGFAVYQQRQNTRFAKAPFQLGDAANYLGDMDQAGGQLNQAGDVCEKLCSFQGRATTQDVLQLVSDVRKTLQEPPKIIYHVYQEGLLSKLPTAGAAFDHFDNQADVACHPNTRVELLKTIYEWTHEPQSPRVFWLQGLAGTGKSTISHTVARELKGDALGASFFFKRGDGDRDNARHLFTTIAYQLARKLPLLCKHICDAIENEPRMVEGYLSVQFQGLILGPLKKLQDEGFTRTLLVVIDALDECEQETHREAIIDLLTKSQLRNLKVFITSRPEFDIRNRFSYANGTYRDLVLHRVDEHVVEHDIRVVLEYHMSKFRREYNQVSGKDSHLADDWPGNKRLQKLVKMCTPLFISVATFLRLLRLWPEGPDTIVNFFLENPATSTSEYGKLYYPVLSRMMELVPIFYRDKFRATFKQVIGSVILLASPLGASPLSRLLKISIQEVDGQLRYLRSVLDLPDENSPMSPIRLFHLSFRDFLVHETDAGEFQVDEAKAHQRLATHCLDVLSETLKADVYGLVSPGKDRSSIKKTTLLKRLPSEAQYASISWVYHVKESECMIKDGSPAHQFMLKYFLNWLESLSLMHKLSEASRLIDDLQQATDVEDGIKMSRFLKDARRFVFASRAMVDRTPLQLYMSALVFAPEASLVRQTFESKIPQWLVQLPLVESDWSACLHEFGAGRETTHCVTFLANGRVAMTNATNINIIDPKNGTYIHTLYHNRGRVLALAVSPDGRLASASSEGTVRIWDPKNSECLGTYLVPDTTDISSMAFSASGHYLSVVTKEHKGRLIDSHTCDMVLVYACNLRRNSVGDPAVKSERFSNDGKWLALSRNRTIKLFEWETARDTKWRYLTSPQRAISKMDFSADGNVLYSASYENTVVLWDTATGQCLRTIECPCTAITAVVCSRDRVAVGSTRGNVAILNLDEGSQTQILPGHESATGSLAFSPDGELLASFANGSSAKIWDLTVPTSETGEGHIEPVREIAFASNFKLAVSSDLVRKITIWDVRQGTRKEKLTFNGLTAMATAERASLLGVGLRGQVQIIDLDTMSTTHTLATSFDWVRSLSFTPDGRRLAAASSPREGLETQSAVQIWDMKDPDAGHVGILPIDGTGKVDSVALSPDGERVLFVKENIEIVTTNISTDECWTTDFRDVSVAGFSSDGRHVIAGRRRWAGKIWDSKTGQFLREWSDLGFLTHDCCKFQPSFFRVEAALSEPASSLFPRGEDHMSRYHVSQDGRWLVRDGEKVLWLPLEYAASCAATKGSMIVIGSRRGRVIVIGLE